MCREPDRTRPRQRSRLRRELRTHKPLVDGQRRPASAGTTVWKFADAPQLPDAHELPGWLGQAVLSLVRTYSLPGERVLLLDATTSTAPYGTTPHPYAAIGETLWTIMRLARGVRHAATRSATIEEAVDNSDRARVDLLIAALPPADLNLANLDVARLLNRRGTLAVITHGQPARRLPYGAVTAVVNMAAAQELRWLEHIVVESGEMPPAPAAVGLPVRTVHNDVLVFGWPESHARNRSEDLGD